MIHICAKCQKKFRSPAKFDAHTCVTQSAADDRKARLDRMLASGACSQAYYDTAINAMQASN